METNQIHAPLANADLDAWVKEALAGLTHITEMDHCIKCKRVISNEVPVDATSYKVSCGHCKHTWTKSRFQTAGAK